MDIYKILLYIISYVLAAGTIIKIGKDYVNKYPEYGDQMRVSYMLAFIPIANMWIALIFLYLELKKAYGYDDKNVL